MRFFLFITVFLMLWAWQGSLAQAQLSMNNSGAGGGAVVVGGATVACDSTVAGGLRYDSSTPCIEICDGASWTCMVSGTCDYVSGEYTFTNLTDLALSTLYTSNIVLLTGMDAGCSTGISLSAPSGGSPEYRVCNNSDCSSVDIDWTGTANTSVVLQGKYLQLRATTAPGSGTNRNITATVGLAGVATKAVTWGIRTSYVTCGNNPIGFVCSDGTVYVGTSPDGNVPMYATLCDYGQTWDGAACTGTRTTLAWNNGEDDWINATPDDCGSIPACDVTGETHTATLGTSDSDSDTGGTQFHAAAKYCNDFNVSGRFDWYLPSAPELNVIFSNAAVISGLAAANYWSSSEFDLDEALAQNMSTGASSAVMKNQTLNIRCVRR